MAPPAPDDRFLRFDIENREWDPEKTALLAGPLEYELGTASLGRQETISLLGCNSYTGERLQLRLRWRPAGALVSLLSELRLTTSEGRTLSYRQLESYQPEPADRPLFGAHKRQLIGQYGSGGSRLKLVVASPYRRMWFSFAGHMEPEGVSAEAAAADQPPPEPVFVRLSCVITSCSQIYDYLASRSRRCPAGAADEPWQALAGLVYGDRHEQRVRLAGELALSGGPAKRALSLRGLYVRHLLAVPVPAPLAPIRTARLYVQLQNGKSFHIGATGAPAGPQRLHFGYTQFLLQPLCESIVDFAPTNFGLLWQRERLLSEPILVRSQQDDELLTCRLLELEAEPNWFRVVASSSLSPAGADIELPGWAYWTPDDEILDSAATLEAIEASRRERARLIELGELLPERQAGGAAEAAAEPTERPLVVSIEELACTSSELVGAKAASLAQLHRHQRDRPAAEYRVPYALVLTRHAYELVRHESGPQLAAQLAALVGLLAGPEPEPGAGRVRECCRQLRELLAGSSVPARLAEQLLARLDERWPPGEGPRRFAIRSSSWGEDEADMSAAGQLSTLLNVRLEPGEPELGPLGRALMACFASKFSYENVQYKRQHGLPIDLPMAVVVQEMVGCQKAGVMFTCDPVTGDESRLTITANYGLGESVVSAGADPDSIVVRAARAGPNGEPQLAIGELRIGKKELVLACLAEGTGEQARGPDAGSPAQDRARCCLEEREILQLARQGLRLRRLYSCRQRHCDIEFGYLEGQLYLFQCRPVTGLDQPGQEELLHEFDRTPATEFVFYTRANVGEVMPYAMKPFTLTYMLTHWCVLTAQLQLEHQPAKGARQAHQLYVPQCTTADMATEKYHTFLNMFGSNYLRLTGNEGAPKPTLARALEIGMFGRELEPQRDLMEAASCFNLAPSPFAGFRYQLKILRMRLSPTGYIESVRRPVERLYRQLSKELGRRRREARHEASEPERAARLCAAYGRLKALLRQNYICFKLHISATFLDGENHLELNKLLANHIQDPNRLSAGSNRFLALARDVISAQIPQRIGSIARDIGSAGEARAFLQLNDKEALEYLHKRKQFQEFMDKFGHRCYSEFDLADKTWHEQPERLLELIRIHCRQAPAAGPANGTASAAASAAASGTSKGQPERRGDSFERVLESLGLQHKLTRMERLRLRHLLAPRCQLYLASRERTKNMLILYIGCLRLAARMLALEMRAQLRLPDEELLYFVPFDELEPLCHDYQPRLVMMALKRRQLFERLFPANEAWKFDEIIRSPELTPNHLKANKELEAALKGAPRLRGVPASSGKARGRVCLVNSYLELGRVSAGSILLTHSTDIAFSPIFPLIGGIITEVGGLISHGAVVARECGLPCLIGIPNVTQILQDGEEILLDADEGSIIRLAYQEPAAIG